jgi:hypothetical protein
VLVGLAPVWVVLPYGAFDAVGWEPRSGPMAIVDARHRAACVAEILRVGREEGIIPPGAPAA